MFSLVWTSCREKQRGSHRSFPLLDKLYFFVQMLTMTLLLSRPLSRPSLCFLNTSKSAKSRALKFILSFLETPDPHSLNKVQILHSPKVFSPSFWTVFGLQKNWAEKYRKWIPPPPQKHSLKPEWYVCYKRWTYTDTSSSPKVHSLCRGSLLGVYILMGFDKCISHVLTITASHRVVSLPPKSSVLHQFLPFSP